MKAASIVFEVLDATVEGFAQSIGNAMFDVSQQADEVALESLRHSHHRLYFAADSALEPLIEEALGGVDAGLVPELAEEGLMMPGFGCCQVTFDQFFEGEEPIIAEVIGLEEPVIARAFQCRVATSQQSGVFLPAHLIYGLPQQSTDVEFIVNDLRLRARFPHGTGVRGTHIHRNGLDRSENVRRQRFQSHDRRRRRAVFHNLQNTPFLQIVEERTITVSFSETLLIDAQVWHLLQFAPGQSSLDRTSHDAIDRPPVQTQPLGRLVGASARQKDLNGKGLECQRPPRTRFSPRHPHHLLRLLDHLLLILFNPSPPRYFGCDDRLQLHGV